MNPQNPEAVETAMPPRPPYPPPYAASPLHKMPLLAAFFSVIMPGLGQLYCGLYPRAAAIFATFVLIFSSTIGNRADEEMGFLIPTMAFVWFFGIFDAYRQATFLNWGIRQEETPAAGGRPNNALMFGVALVAIGLYGALRQLVDIDLTFLVDNWYLIAVAFGGYFIWQALKARKDETSTEG